MKSLSYAYRIAKPQRDFRKLWIARINAARNNGLSYSKFMGVKKAGVKINRKLLADLAINDSAAFSELVKVAQEKR